MNENFLSIHFNFNIFNLCRKMYLNNNKKDFKDFKIIGLDFIFL